MIITIQDLHYTCFNVNISIFVAVILKRRISTTYRYTMCAVILKIFSLFCNYFNSLLKRVLYFNLTFSPPMRMFYSKFEESLHTGPGEKVKILNFTDRRTDRRERDERQVIRKAETLVQVS